jgi:hypothetical protein
VPSAPSHSGWATRKNVTEAFGFFRTLYRAMVSQVSIVCLDTWVGYDKRSAGVPAQRRQ